MKLWLSLLLVAVMALFVVVLVACAVVLCLGMSPARLLRSRLQRPKLHLTDFIGSPSEKKALLTSSRKSRTWYCCDLTDCLVSVARSILSRTVPH